MGGAGDMELLHHVVGEGGLATMLPDLIARGERGHEDGPRFPHELHRLLIQHGPMLNGVHPGANGDLGAFRPVNVGRDRLFHLMGLGDQGLDLLRAVFRDIGRQLGVHYPAGRAELDQVRTDLDLLSHRPQDFGRPVRDTTGGAVNARHARREYVNVTTRGGNYPAGGENPRAGDEAGIDRVPQRKS